MNPAMYRCTITCEFVGSDVEKIQKKFQKSLNDLDKEATVNITAKKLIIVAPPAPEVPSDGSLGSYGQVVHDGYCGEPIGWGFPIIKRLPEAQFNGLTKYGALECLSEGRWVLVTHWLTEEEAVDRYGQVTHLALGPLGGFQSVTYGEKKFWDRRLKPSDLSKHILVTQTEKRSGR